MDSRLLQRILTKLHRLEARALTRRLAVVTSTSPFKVSIGGEEHAGLQRLGDWSPAVNDRVYVARSGKELVVLGRVAADAAGVAGAIQMFGGSTAPSGWLLCNGAQVSRTTYARLDAAIGTNFGSYTNGSGGAGTTHLRLPDMRGRFPIGVGTNVTLGQNDSLAESSRDELHKHSISFTSGAPSSSPNRQEGGGTTFQSPAGGHTHAVTGDTDNDGVTHLGVNYIIKT